MLIYRVKINAYDIISVKYTENGITKYGMMKLEDLYFPNNLNGCIFLRDKTSAECLFGYNELYPYLDEFIAENKHSKVAVNKGILNIDTFDYVVYPDKNCVFIKAHAENSEYLIYYNSSPDVIHSVTKGNYYMLEDYHKVYLEKLLSNSYIQN